MKPIPGLQIESQPPPVVFAMGLCGEARGEGRSGMEAVAQTIMNRVAHPKRYGAGVREVWLQPWQYDCFMHDDPNRAKLLDFWQTEPASYALAEAVAAEALGGALSDTVGPATHYCAILLHGEPLWDCDDEARILAGHRMRWHSHQAIESGITKETARIGHHVFAVTA